MDSYAIGRALRAAHQANSGGSREQIVRHALEHLGKAGAVSDAQLERMIALRKSNADVIEQACAGMSIKAKAVLAKIIASKAAAR